MKAAEKLRLNVYSADLLSLMETCYKVLDRPSLLNSVEIELRLALAAIYDCWPRIRPLPKRAHLRKARGYRFERA